MNSEQFALAAWDALLAAAEVGKRSDLHDIHARLCGDAGEFAAHAIEQYARTPYHAPRKSAEQVRMLRDAETS